MLRWFVIAAAGLACGGESHRADPVNPTPPDRAPPEAVPTDETPAEPTRGLREVDEVGTGERKLDLRFQIRAHSGGEARFIRPGDTLKTGDRVEMFIEIDQPAHLYVLQFFADKTIAVLFPKGDTGARLDPGRHRIPAPGKMFELDETAGEEHVYVVASRTPLESADREVADSVDEVKTSGSRARAIGARPRPNPREKKKPKLLSLGNRGGSRLARTRADPAVTAQGDPNGVLVFRFWFKHE